MLEGCRLLIPDGCVKAPASVAAYAARVAGVRIERGRVSAVCVCVCVGASWRCGWLRLCVVGRLCGRLGGYMIGCWLLGGAWLAIQRWLLECMSQLASSSCVAVLRLAGPVVGSGALDPPFRY